MGHPEQPKHRLAGRVINYQPASAACNHKELFSGRCPRGSVGGWFPVPPPCPAALPRRCHWLPSARGPRQPAVKCLQVARLGHTTLGIPAQAASSIPARAPQRTPACAMAQGKGLGFFGLLLPRVERAEFGVRDGECLASLGRKRGEASAGMLRCWGARMLGCWTDYLREGRSPSGACTFAEGQHGEGAAWVPGAGLLRALRNESRAGGKASSCSTCLSWQQCD